MGGGLRVRRVACVAYFALAWIAFSPSAVARRPSAVARRPVDRSLAGDAGTLRLERHAFPADVRAAGCNTASGDAARGTATPREARATR
jgi:hypothetical protein